MKSVLSLCPHACYHTSVITPAGLFHGDTVEFSFLVSFQVEEDSPRSGGER